MPSKDEHLAKLLGHRIAALRQERGLTQERLAWEVDLSSKGYLSRIESGQRLPSLLVLQRIADRLGVEVRDLFIFPERSVVDEQMEQVRRDHEGRGPKRRAT